MATWRRLIERFVAFWTPGRAERELEREVAAHLTLLEDDFVARGRSRDEARVAARRALGGVDQTKERHRDARSFPWLEDARRDVRYAVRQLCRDRGTAIIGILSLGIGIAAVAAVYSAVDGVLLNPYPYEDVERMVAMRWTDKSGRLNAMPLSEAGFADMLAASAVDDGFLWEAYSTAIRQDREVDSILAAWLSPNAFRFLGVRAELGRTFDGDVVRVSTDPEHAVVLSAGYWQRRFGGDATVLGRSIQLDGIPYTIVGVMPPDFRLLNPDVYIPLPAGAGPYMSYIKLKPGVSHDAAAAELSAIFQRRAQNNGLANWRDLRVVLTDMGEYATGHLAGVMIALSAAVGVLLLIGCANLSILLTSRGITRRHELTMRKALGASNGRLIRQLLTESLLSSMLAGALGIGLGYALLPAIVGWMSFQAIPSGIDVGMNGRVLVFAIIVALIAGLISGVWPSIHLSRPSASPTSRGEVAAAGERRLHSLHLLAQVALTVLLLAASAAALRTFVSLTRASLGYDPASATILNLQLARGAFPAWGERTAYYERLRAALATVPGVESVAISLDTPPPVASGRSGLTIDGVEMTANGNIVMQRVSSDYFTTLRTPLRRGRMWTTSEDGAATHVAVVNEALVRAYFPDADPIGRRIELAGLDRRSPYSLASPNYDRVVEIIGIVADARNAGLGNPVMPAAYVPHTLLNWDSVRFLVRATGTPSSIERAARRRIAEVNGDQALGNVTTMNERLRIAGWARQQSVAMLFLWCAGAALLLAAVGLYSVVACAVSQRQREIAVRMALGASPQRVASAVLRATALTVLAGVAFGLALTVALDMPLRQWTDASLWSLPSLAQVITVLAIVAGAAVVVPVRRAVSLDPMVILRGE